MKSWKERFHTFWMNTDDKPKGKDRRYIEKQNRQDAKRDIGNYYKTVHADNEAAWADEIDKAMACWEKEQAWEAAGNTEPYQCTCNLEPDHIEEND